MAEHGIEAKVAVIIPTLNEAGVIEACLESIGERSSIEIVVVDGGSTDSTKALAAAAGARVEQSERGRGPQLNRGAEMSTATKMLFLHADCRLPNGWFEPLERALDQESIALACYRLRTESASISKTSFPYRLALRTFDLRSRGCRLPYGDQGLAVRRETFRRVGGFPDLPLMEDVAFAAACKAHGLIRRLPLEVRTSARRLERGPLRTMLAYVAFPTLFRFGISPDRLARWYGDPR